MLDIFKPMPAATQTELRIAYREFLRERDGEPNYQLRTLQRREERMARFVQPLARVRDIDHQLFNQQFAHFDSKRETPPEMLLLLGLVKLNAAEAYGVNRIFESSFQRLKKTGDELEMMLLLEESYHTKILLSTAGLYGLEVTEPYSPAAAFRALIGGIAHAPEFISRPLTLAGEILGTLGLFNLLNVARKRLSHDPELRDAVEERIIDILVDEIGHISFNRMIMSSRALMQTRILLPMVGLSLGVAAPEVGLLGALPTDPTESIHLLYNQKLLPESVRSQAFIA
jgi:hypothetical protein